MSSELSLSASMEDYLEAIANIQQQKKVVRVKDIAKYLKVKMPSVSGALKSLVNKNLVNHESYEYVGLTEQGQQIAQEVARKHEILRRFLVDILGLDENSAREEACNMEHTIGKQSLQRLVKFVEFVNACSGGGPACLKRFRHAVETGDFNIVCPVSGENIIDSKTAPNASDVIAREVRYRYTGQNEGETKSEEEKTVTEKSLNQLNPGMKGTITKVKGRGQLHRRILDMGVVRGTTVEVEKVAPLGDPIDIIVRGYHLSLRKSEAANIFVEVVEQ